MDIEELLIDCVKEHTVLYDPREKKYMDLSYKAEIWRKVAAQCGLSSGDSAKELWKKLRDAYRSCKKRKRGRSETSNTSMWKYEEQMSFLHPYMKDRPRRINNNILDSRVATETQSDEGHCSEPFPVILSDTSQVSPAIQNDNSILPTSPLPISDVSNIYNTHTSAKTHKAVLEFFQGEAKKRRKIKQQHLEHEDPLKLFFNSMYASTKILPLHLQRKVKKELFQVVADAEEEAETYLRTFPSHMSCVETASISSSSHD